MIIKKTKFIFPKKIKTRIKNIELLICFFIIKKKSNQRKNKYETDKMMILSELFCLHVNYNCPTKVMLYFFKDGYKFNNQGCL